MGIKLPSTDQCSGEKVIETSVFSEPLILHERRRNVRHTAFHALSTEVREIVNQRLKRHTPRLCFALSPLEQVITSYACFDGGVYIREEIDELQSQVQSASSRLHNIERWTQFNRFTTTMQKTQEILSKATGGKIGSLLPTRKLGKNGPQVTAIGYGCMGLVWSKRMVFRCYRADQL